jgi:hypothetical protein
MLQLTWTRKPGGILKALYISASPGTRLRSRKDGSLNRYAVPVARPFAGSRLQAYGKPPGFRLVSPQVQEECGWLRVYSLC